MKKINFKKYTVTKCRDHNKPRIVKSPTKLKPLPTYKMDATTSIRRTGKFKIKKRLDVLAASKPTLASLFKDSQ